MGTVVDRRAGDLWCCAAPGRVTHVTGTPVTPTGAQRLSGLAGSRRAEHRDESMGSPGVPPAGCGCHWDPGALARHQVAAGWRGRCRDADLLCRGAPAFTQPPGDAGRTIRTDHPAVHLDTPTSP